MAGHLDMNRRRFLQYAGYTTGAVALGGLLAACGKDNASGESGTLRINSFGGSFEAAIREHAVAPFEKANSGTKVAITTSLGAATATQLKAAPDGSSPYDLVYMDPVPVAQCAAAGKLQKLDTSKITPFADLIPLAVSPAGYSIAHLIGVTGISYNTDKVKTPPTSWQDLWKPEYAGKVVISDVSGTAGYQFLLEAAKLNGGSEANIDPGFNAIKKLKPNLASIYSTPDQAIQLLSSGEAWIGVAYGDRTASAKAQGAPISFAFPDEGALAILSSIAIPAASGNLDLAYKWMSFVLSPDVMKPFLTATPEGPVNKKVTFDDKFAAANFIPQGKTLDQLRTFDYTQVATSLPEWTTRWGSEIAG